MSKSILVIDTPENCVKCILYHYTSCRCYITGKFQNNISEDYKPGWCPLRELAKKKDMDFREECSMYISRYWEGYNALIDEILKGDNGNEV